MTGLSGTLPARVRRVFRVLLGSRRRRFGVFALAAAAAAAVWLRCGPLPSGLLDAAAIESTIVLDRHGVPLYEALSDEGTRSVRLSAGSIPDLVAAATIAAEDHRFEAHWGLDPIAVGRAVKRNVAERRIAEGGSTISQQTAKLLLQARDPDRKRGWGAKLFEALIALRLEHRLSKRGILALYLNAASYGNQITGIERASRAYFGVEAQMLTAAQAAFLAGLPQRPTTFNPYRNEDLARSRQRVILRRMVATGALAPADADRARAERLTFAREPHAFRAPHFVSMVLARSSNPRPARIRTTLDAGLQAAVAGILRSHRPALDRHGAGHVAVVVLDNAAGEWLAWEGSGSYDTAAIDGATSPRQPGSALKPFTYALAFEEGFTPASVLPDLPQHFPTAEPGVVYSPRNYDGRYRGPLLARVALAGSQNVPAVALAAELGVPKLLRFLRRAGFTTFDKSAAHYGLGVTLGNAEVRLDELVAAYSAFARGGQWLAPTYLPRERSAADTRTLVRSRTAFWIEDILSDAEARAHAFGRGGSLEFPFPAAVKTGTSQAYHDNWTVGFTRRVTVGVWVGNFDRRPLRNSSGVTGAAPIFHDVLLEAHARFGEIGGTARRPESSLSAIEVCALSGEGAGSWCPVRRREWLDRRAAPPSCSWHHPAEGGAVVAWPARYRGWAERDAGLRSALPQVPPPAAVAGGRRSRAVAAEEAALTLVNPPGGATYLIDPTLRRDFQTLPLKAVAPAPVRLEWTVNGIPYQTASSDMPVEWPLRTGVHTIAARDPLGNVVETTITVK